MFIKAARAWQADNIFQHSAAVSFYTLFSLAPITIIAVTVAGWFLGRDQANRQLLSQLTELVGPASARTITEAARASQTDRHGWWATWAGVILIIVGATTVFGQLQRSFNTIWGVEAHPGKNGWIILVLQRLISFAMVLTIGFLLLVSLILTTLLTSALREFDGTLLASDWRAKGADLLVGLAVVSVLFALLFKVMPDVRLRWGEVWRGALVTAGLFTIGRYAIALYLGHSTVASVYGSAGSVVALLLWIYYSCAILFFGVEWIRADAADQGRPVEPKKTAVLTRPARARTSAPAREPAP